MEKLYVSLLGEQAIRDDRSGVRPCSSRAVAVVAFLVAHAGMPQARQRIAGLFWPDSTDAQALTNLRRELHYLRQVLGGEPSLVVTSTDLCWRDTETCRVDARVFHIERMAALAAAGAGDPEGILTHAGRAIAEYGGDLLPGVYDDWLLEVRLQLERECVDLCDLAAATRARTGDLTGAVDAARRRIRLQPLEEVGYRTLMELQAELGDRAAYAVESQPTIIAPRSWSVSWALSRILPLGGPFRSAGSRGADGGNNCRHSRSRQRPLRARGRATRRPSAGTRPAAGPVADGRCRNARSRPGPRRRGSREDAPGVRDCCHGTGPRRASREYPVLRNVGAASADARGGLAEKPRRRGGGGDSRPGLAGRGRQGLCRREATGHGGQARGPWPTHGNDIASSRASPGRCSPSADRCCWCWITCSGVTRRR